MIHLFFFLSSCSAPLTFNRTFCVISVLSQNSDWLELYYEDISMRWTFFFLSVQFIQNISSLTLITSNWNYFSNEHTFKLSVDSVVIFLCFELSANCHINYDWFIITHFLTENILIFLLQFCVETNCTTLDFVRMSMRWMYYIILMSLRKAQKHCVYLTAEQRGLNVQFLLKSYIGQRWSRIESHM